MTLLRLKARCPHCYHRPNLRVPSETVAKHRTDPPDLEVAHLTCHRCGTVYPLTARAYQEAAA